MEEGFAPGIFEPETLWAADKGQQNLLSWSLKGLRNMKYTQLAYIEGQQPNTSKLWTQDEK
jgi:hypothetical protein